MYVIKSTILRSSLSIFAVMLAVIASFAFSSADADTTSVMFYQTRTECELVSANISPDCSIFNTGETCTITISNSSYSLYTT